MGLWCGTATFSVMCPYDSSGLLALTIVKNILKLPSSVVLACMLCPLACVTTGAEVKNAHHSPASESPFRVARLDFQKDSKVGTVNAPREIELRHERAAYPWLGVELKATGPKEAGVKIARVLPGSPAEVARLKEGDVLLSLGEAPANSPSEVAEWVRAQENGAEHPIAVLRAGKQHLFSAKLVGMPEFEDRLRLAFVGKRAPEITGIVTFQGESASLEELKGQVVVLEFWASFCGVCRFLAPVLDTWSRRYQPLGAEVIGITMDNPKLGLDVARRTGMTYTLSSDTGGEVTRSYFASQIPTLFVIDRSGIVRDAVVGYSKERLAETQSLIEELLQQDP